jgi:3-dehydroquinate dehydratase
MIDQNQMEKMIKCLFRINGWSVDFNSLTFEDEVSMIRVIDNDCHISDIEARDRYQRNYVAWRRIPWSVVD